MHTPASAGNEEPQLGGGEGRAKRVPESIVWLGKPRNITAVDTGIYHLETSLHRVVGSTKQDALFLLNGTNIAYSWAQDTGHRTQLLNSWDGGEVLIRQKRAGSTLSSALPTPVLFLPLGCSYAWKPCSRQCTRTAMYVSCHPAAHGFIAMYPSAC